MRKWPTLLLLALLLSLALTLAACSKPRRAPTPEVPAPQPPATGEPIQRCAQPEPVAQPGLKTIRLYYNCVDDPVPAPPRPVYRQVDQAEAGVARALQELLKGPTAEEQQAGYNSWFSDRTSGLLRSAMLDPDGRLTVDFADFSHIIPNASTSAGSALLISSLRATIFQFPQVQEAELQFGGSCEAFWHWLQSDCQPLTRLSQGAPAAVISFHVTAAARTSRPGETLYLEHGDSLTVTLHFPQPMERRSVGAALRTRLPEGSTVAWVDDRQLTVSLPAGDSFLLSAEGARTADGSGQIGAGHVAVERPPQVSIALYSPDQLLDGQTQPQQLWQHRFWLNGITLAPDGETALLYQGDPHIYGPIPHLLHLPTGRRQMIDQAEDAYYGYAGWLSDGRLLLAGRVTLLGSGNGESMQRIATPAGFAYRPSPDGRQLAVGGGSQITLVDLTTGAARLLDYHFRKGYQGPGMTFAWSPDSRFIAGTDHDREGAPESPRRVRMIEAATGLQTSTIDGQVLEAWLATGDLLVRDSLPAPGQEPAYRLVDSAGNEKARWTGWVQPSPDGRFLLRSEVVEGRYQSTMTEIATGRTALFHPSGYPRWTQSSQIMAVR